MAKAPKVKIQGVGSIPSGYMLGRTSPGIGDVELLTPAKAAHMVARTGVVSTPGNPSPLATIPTARVLGNTSGSDAAPVATALTQPAAGITITPGGSAFTFALANDLAGLEAMSSVGLVTRTGDGTYADRTLTGTSNRISVSNGDGVAGNPAVDIDAAYVGQTSITTLGTVTTGTWNAGTVASHTDSVGVFPASTTDAGWAITSNYFGYNEVDFWSTVEADGFEDQGFYFLQKTGASSAELLGAIYGDSTFSALALIGNGGAANGQLFAEGTDYSFVCFTGGMNFSCGGGASLRARFEDNKGPEITGTPTNDSAVAGNLGEYLTGQTNTTSMTSTTSVDLTSVSLTAGDWDVDGTVQLNPAGGTITTNAKAGISTTTGTLPTAMTAGGYAAIDATTAAGVSHVMQTGTQRVSLASTTTVYLVGQATFSVSTMTGSGFIRARRVR